ncbi:nucleic acid dioxygenase ALKBH1-like [Strongylocentrotus purpuratus]|uniref:Alpha-ketoglutarate-dependent dioxygenase AlkB-like domain-containing protein n=1 Tax=Strongylocentrotus purpuratus TaxID=7668 RepID=A0A7M7PNE9_STRPU|nr:nucleic acid dioxygenase ALKBH1-like [Strongylocentrotus purpuratus]
MADISEDNFRPEFKLYKRKSPPPCLEDVLDTDSDGHRKMLYKLELSELAQEQNYQKNISDAARFGLKNPNEWQCYGAHGFPGFQFIRNPFLPGAQRYWVRRCLADYPCKPNVTNLDTQYQKDQLTNPWQFQPCSSPNQQTQEKRLMDQLRWVTLGYHYDWNNKVYNEDQHSPFPEDLGPMSALIAEVLGYPRFQSQAAIVNFYHMDSTLGGHTDHSEFDLTAPLISYSLGQSAILLVGGKTKATKPLALHLRSGDVIILGGESRLAYHAVPKIMYAQEEGRLPQCLGATEDQQQWQESQEEVVVGSRVEVGDHPAVALRGAQKGMKDEHEESGDTTYHAYGGHSGKLSGSGYSSAAASVDQRPNVHSKQCPDHSSPNQLCESQGRYINSTTLEDTVSRTTLSNSADSQHVDLGGVAKNISSAIRDLSQKDQWREFEEYLKHARINISVRQVTGPGKGFPQKESCHEESDRDMVQSSNTKRIKISDS